MNFSSAYTGCIHMLQGNFFATFSILMHNIYFVVLFLSFFFFNHFARLQVQCRKLQSLKGRDLMEKIGIHPKSQRELLQIHVPKQERVERQAQVQAMMAFHKGLAILWLI